MQRQVQLDIIVWKEDKHYIAQCLNVDISSFGNSKEEALENLREAVELYLEDALPDTITKIEAPEIVHSKVKYA